MHAWKPGETITAARLRSGYASGRATIPFTNATGRETVSATNSGYDRDYYRQTVDVTFPDGAFTSTPQVSATWAVTVPGTVIELTVTNITPTGCTIRGARTPNAGDGIAADSDVMWIAIDSSN